MSLSGKEIAIFPKQNVSEGNAQSMAANKHPTTNSPTIIYPSRYQLTYMYICYKSTILKFGVILKYWQIPTDEHDFTQSKLVDSFQHWESPLPTDSTNPVVKYGMSKSWPKSLIWGFPLMEVPLNHPRLFRMFPYEPSSECVVPPWLRKPPICRRWILTNSSDMLQLRGSWLSHPSEKYNFISLDD